MGDKPAVSGSWAAFLAFSAALLLLVVAKRWITRRLQELSMRWVGDPDVALVLYFIVVLPGVVIHELSHWLVALVLGVRVRKLRIGPVRKGRGRRVSLGSVQVANVDPLRASLIGLAPLLGGTAVILLIGNLVLGIDTLAEMVVGQGLEGVWPWLGQVVHVPDVWIWLYLIFAISNAMLPSDSDMAAMRPVLIFLGLVALVVLVIGGVPAIPAQVAQIVNALASYLASALVATLAADLVFMVAIGALTWLTRWIARRSSRL